MFGPLETKDLAQIAITVVGLAVIFLYFNRRLTTMTSLIHQHETMITNNNTEQQDSKFEAFGEILHALNDRISGLEMANHALAQQLEAIKHQRNTVSVVQEPQQAKRKQPPVASQQAPSIPKPEQVVEQMPKSEAGETRDSEMDNATMDELLSEELGDLVEDDDEIDLKKEE